MHLNSVISRDPHILDLKRAVDHDSLPHAILFRGPEGSGKLATALAFVRYLFCNDRQSDGTCGKCAGCVKTEKIIHPDVHFLFPRVGGSEASVEKFLADWREALQENPYLNLNDWIGRIAGEKSRAYMYANDIAATTEKLQLHSFEGGRRLILIWRAEYLVKEGNKLLKLIEEPPPNTYLVLIAENVNEVLPTIVSRCQQFHFRPMRPQQVVRYLEHHANIEPERASSIANNCHGNLNLAMKMMTKTSFFPLAWLKSWLEALWKKDYSALNKWVHSTSRESKPVQKEYFAYMLDILHKVFWLKWGMVFETDQEEMEIVKWLNKKIEFNELEPLAKLAEDSIQVIDRNANAKILWMDASVQFRGALMRKHAAVRV